MALPKVTKKKKPRAARRVNTGEPQFENVETLTGPEYSKLYRRIVEYYRLERKNSDYKTWIVAYAKAHPDYKDKASTLNKVSDNRYGPSVGASARLLSRGWPDTHPAYIEHWESLAGTMGTVAPLSEYLHKILDELYNIGLTIVEEKKAIEGKRVVPKETIQDRLREQLYEIIGEIEGAVDDFTLEGKSFDTYKFLNTQGLAANSAPKIVEFYKPLIVEIEEYLKGECEQLNEAYAHLGKRDAKNFIKFIQSIIDGANAYKSMKISTRAKPKKRIVTPDKVVRNLKYLKTFKLGDLEFKSIDPRDIIECSELWTYNTKTRKLGRFVSTKHNDMTVSYLTVKSTSIIGQNEAESISKTLRKPEEQLTKWKSSSRAELRKFLGNIKGTEVRLRPRISPETILLKVIK
jgi:hypothetical protein